jgi:hypothetical protein
MDCGIKNCQIPLRFHHGHVRKITLSIDKQPRQLASIGHQRQIPDRRLEFCHEHVAAPNWLCFAETIILLRHAVKSIRPPCTVKPFSSPAAVSPMNHFLPSGRKNLADAFAKSIFPCNLMVLLLKRGMMKN